VESPPDQLADHIARPQRQAEAELPGINSYDQSTQLEHLPIRQCGGPPRREFRRQLRQAAAPVFLPPLENRAATHAHYVRDIVNLPASFD
jgi:hypothetical protein